MKHLKTVLITLAKIAISLGIIGYLFYSALNTPEGRTAFFEMLREQKAWGMLLAGFLLLVLAVLVTLVRWWYLVRALDIDLALPDAIRIGFIGYLFNMAPLGIVGGDLLKAWLLAKEKPGNRAKALASVIVDRIVGLYVLFLVAAVGIFITGLWHHPNMTVHVICRAVLVATAVSTVGIAVILIPGFLETRMVLAITKIPKIGHAIESLVDAIRIYRGKRTVLFLTSLMTVPVHTLLTISIFVLALGLGFGRVPWKDYFAIYPVSGIASTIPLPAGPADAGIVFFYKTAWLSSPATSAAEEAGHEPTAGNAQKAHNEALILALVYRLSTILIAPIGAAYYFLGGRGEVTEVLHEVEEEEDEESRAAGS